MGNGRDNADETTAAGTLDTTHVKAFFERVASRWDDMRLAWYDERVIEELARRTHLEPTSTILDVGTGTGFVAAGLALRVTRVVAVDHSPAMLQVARQNLDALEIRNVDLREADFVSLPLDDDSVHASVANMALHHAEAPRAALREMARVTAPGGWVAITDEVAHHFAWMHTEHADVWLGFEQDEVAAFFRSAGLGRYGYAALGYQ